MEVKDELKCFRLAKQWNDTFHQRLQESELHFRGNLNSYSLISLNENTPEIGFSGMKSSREIHVEKKIEDAKSLQKPGRETREKHLQAWLIKQTLLNNGRIPFRPEIRFITSEMAVSVENKKSYKRKNGKGTNKIVNDILGYSDDGSLYVIELKSDRLASRLKVQVNNFAAVIEANPDLFDSLLTLQIGDNHQWKPNKVKKMIVWPKPKGNPRDPGCWSNCGVEEICYDEDDYSSLLTPST